MKRLLLLTFLLLLLPLHGCDKAPTVVSKVSTTQSYTLSSVPSYCFKGTHYTASYYECDAAALRNHIHLIAYFVKAIDASQATLLKITKHVFENGAISIAAVLSESHATIHTYPELNAVFVDLFTCGDKCDWKSFEEILKSTLEPDKIRRKVRVRK